MLENENLIDIFKRSLATTIKSIGKTNFISIEIIRNNDLILKEFELKYNQEFSKYIIGISSTNTPIINRFTFFDSFTQSIIFIPNYYYATFNYLIKSKYCMKGEFFVILISFNFLIPLMPNCSFTDSSNQKMLFFNFFFSLIILELLSVLC